MNRLRIYWDSRCLKHPGTGGNAEVPERLLAIQDAINKSTLLKEAEISTANPCSIQDLALVHDEKYLQFIQDACEKEVFLASAEIMLAKDSWTALKLTVGAGIESVQSIQNNEMDCAFIAMRPPGHHAERAKAMGFCLVNNVAITAEYAKKNGFERILILDWDVHHGNGTQHIFWDDPNVFFISIHQENIYPFMDDRPEHSGGGEAVGKTLNVPLPYGSDGNDLKQVWLEKIDPTVIQFQPNLIIISAGFDAHKLDHLAGLQFVEEDYQWMTSKVNQWAKRFQAKIISYLEGGYNLTALANSVVVHCETLLKGN
ncbi:MAG: histone deacetylase [bacterium]|nr:histone deacetylase [bacterium]